MRGMDSDRNKPGVAFWATVVVVVVLLVAYPASFVGVVMLDNAGMVPNSAYPTLQTIYAPCLWLLSAGWQIIH